MSTPEKVCVDLIRGKRKRIWKWKDQFKSYLNLADQETVKALRWRIDTDQNPKQLTDMHCPFEIIKQIMAISTETKVMVEVSITDT